jgi:hypothetical protein
MIIQGMGLSLTKKLKIPDTTPGTWLGVATTRTQLLWVKMMGEQQQQRGSIENHGATPPIEGLFDAYPKAVQLLIHPPVAVGGGGKKVNHAAVRVMLCFPVLLPDAHHEQIAPSVVRRDQTCRQWPGERRSLIMPCGQPPGRENGENWSITMLRNLAAVCVSFVPGASSFMPGTCHLLSDACVADAS